MDEFGRTPLVNQEAGRDHWASVFSALVADGCSRVIGCSDGALIPAKAFAMLTIFSPQSTMS
jgi:uncharacterized protein DUF1501